MAFGGHAQLLPCVKASLLKCLRYERVMSNRRTYFIQVCNRSKRQLFEAHARFILQPHPDLTQTLMPQPDMHLIRNATTHHSDAGLVIGPVGTR